MAGAKPTTTSQNDSQCLNVATDDGYMRASQVAEFLSIGINTWWRWVSEGIAPKGRQLSPGVTVWKRSEIHAFVESRANQ